jgi:DNA-binding NtrC family response regulator
MNTLIVDDERLVRWFFERTLKKWGHSVVTAESVKEADTVLHQNTFDTIVVDLRFPDGNGMILVRKLLDDRYKPQQIVVCSACVSPSIQEELNDRGVKVLRKPFLLDELRQVVRCEN